MTGIHDEVRLPISQFRMHISRVLREVEGGASYVITRFGRPVARLEPSEAAHPVREPSLPLFASVATDLGSRVDDLLEGFGGP